LQQADRVRAATEAASHHGAELLVLDDGFQHRRLARDLDLVLIDATNPFGYGHLLPRGLLREPIESLRRADLILLTRADAVSAGRKQLIIETIREVAPRPPIVEVTFPAAGLVNDSGERRPVEHLSESPLLAFCGIGNPDGFGATLAAARLRPAELVAFADHHHYGPADLAGLGRRGDAYGVAAAVTTLKDLVKIRSDSLPGPTSLPLWAVETGCEVTANSAALFGRLDALVGKIAGRQAA
jgi:tetraacyldisaccharide 4'-kinase